MCVYIVLFSIKPKRSGHLIYDNFAYKILHSKTDPYREICLRGKEYTLGNQTI